MATSGKEDEAPRRRNLTYREKLAIIQKKEEEPSWTQRALAMWAKEHFRLPNKPTQATISNLLRGKDKVLSTSVPPDFCAARRVRHPELDQQMVLWVQHQLQNDATVTRVAVQKRAAELAREMKLPADMTFSKGWVSSFVKRHQLNLRGKSYVEQSQRPKIVRSTEEIEEEEDNAVEMEKMEELEMEKEEGVVTESRQSGKRRRVDTGNDLWEAMGTGMSEEGRAATELLLDWIAVPGSYSRWWLLKPDADREPLCEEINLFLRSHGLRDLTSMEIQKQLTAFVETFQAAHLWLRQTRVEYPLNGDELALKQECVKSHVLHMCPHYERLAAVLVPYSNYDDNAGVLVQSDEASSTTVKILASNSGAITSQVDTKSDAIDTPKREQKLRRQSTGSSSDNSVYDETKAQKRHLFELECTRLESEIETKKIRLVLEKTLARKKLLDAGISPEEVDRIFPL